MKEFMDKAPRPTPKASTSNAETYAKKAMEIDPNELAASMLAFKAKMERRYKTDVEIRATRRKGSSGRSRKSTSPRSPIRKSRSTAIKIRQELQGPDPRSAAR